MVLSMLSRRVAKQLSSRRFVLFLLSNSTFAIAHIPKLSGNQSRSFGNTACSLLPMMASAGDSNDPSKFLELNESVWYHESAMRREALDKCVPPLTPQGHKGSSGRVGILGGSARYTGAPYYASMAALNVGADLAFCFCAEEASIPIKSYSPELMVAPIYNAAQFDSFVKKGDMKSEQAEASIHQMVEQVEEMFDKLHALVIGPGLGRCPMVMEAASRIIQKAQERNCALVLDADALFLISLPEYRDLLGPSTASDSDKDRRQGLIVLTPNVMERKRLQGLEEQWDQNRVIVVQKGLEDVIESNIGGSETDIRCKEIGGLKRSGGIGDVLAGTLGTFLAWNAILTSRGDATLLNAPLACWAACSVVKRSTHLAFHEHHRSMTAPDVLHALGPTFHAMTTIG